MNKFIGIGRCVKDSEINSSGKVAVNCMAIDRNVPDANGNRATDFINLRWLGEKKAIFANSYIHKGMKIAIEGSLVIDNYKDYEGNSKQSVYIVVDNTEFCERKENKQETVISSKQANFDNDFLF